MKKIRKGNDIDILWKVFDAHGDPYSLTGASIKVYLVVAGRTILVSSPTVDENTISFTYAGRDQQITGMYGMLLVQNDGNADMVTHDVQDAFSLVPHSWLAGGHGRPDVDVVSVEVSSRLNAAPPTADEIIDALGYTPADVRDIPDVSRFITKTVNDLVYYYTKSETYTKTQVQALVAAIQGLSFVVVNELPEATELTLGKIYLVPSDNPQAQNVKDEFITITDNDSYVWENIGNTQIDLSGYVTTTALNTALANYTTTNNLNTLLAGKQDVINDLDAIRSGAAAGATAYQKPSTGIPASDLATGVIPTVPTRQYATVSDMKADETINVGDLVQTMGYYSKGDGGGALYSITESGAQDIGLCHELANGRYANIVAADNVIRMKQVGIDGTPKQTRLATSVYPWLTLAKMQELNANYDANTTAETYALQFLVANLRNYATILLDGKAYYLTETIHLRSFISISGLKQKDFNSFGSRSQKPDVSDTVGYYDISTMMIVTPEKPMFDTGTDANIQVLALRNFTAVGTFGKTGFNGQTPGDFLKLTCGATNWTMQNLCITNFANAVNNNENYCYWFFFEMLYVSNMKDNGLFLKAGSNQINCGTILNSRFFHCGQSESNGVLSDIELDIPGESGNCIFIGGSGTLIKNVDLSSSPVGVFVQAYGLVEVDGTYSESLKGLCVIYEDNAGPYIRNNHYNVTYAESHIKHKVAFIADIYGGVFYERMQNGGRAFLNKKGVNIATNAISATKNIGLGFETKGYDALEVRFKFAKLHNGVANNFQSMRIAPIRPGRGFTGTFLVDMDTPACSANRGGGVVNTTVKPASSENGSAYVVVLNPGAFTISNNTLHIPYGTQDIDAIFQVTQKFKLFNVNTEYTLVDSGSDYTANIGNYSNNNYGYISLSFSVQSAPYNVLYSSFVELYDSDATYYYYKFVVSRANCAFWSDMIFASITVSQAPGDGYDIELLSVSPCTPVVPNNRILISNYPGDINPFVDSVSSKPCYCLSPCPNGFDFFYKGIKFTVFDKQAYTRDGFRYVYSLPEDAIDGEKVWVDVSGSGAGTKYIAIDGVWVAPGTKVSGTTRPTLPATAIGFRFFDETISKPIWWAGTDWVDATGASV